MSSAVWSVAVGSANPSKVDAVREAFTLAFPRQELDIIGLSVDSGVSHQPMNEEETRRGALNRASKAAEAFRAQHGGQQPDFSVGLEGGVKEEHYGDGHASLYCFAWMAVLQPSTGRQGTAKTGSFALPKPVEELVRQGVEVGEADDRVFKRVNSKHGNGVVGILTHGVIPRSAYYSHALVLALIPLLNTEIY